MAVDIDGEEVVSTFVRKTYFIFIHDTELNRPLLWFTSLKLFHFLKQLYSSECTYNLDEVKYFEFFKPTVYVFREWNLKKKKKKIVYLAMPASMSHCFVISFYTQTSFNRGLCTEKPVNVSKTVPYLWWKSCRSKNTYQRPAKFGTVGLSLITTSIYRNRNLLLFINYFHTFLSCI